MTKLADNEKAARLLERAKVRWFKHGTTDTYARDKQGNAVDPVSKRACQWCAIGAITKEARGKYPQYRDKAFNALAEVVNEDEAVSVYGIAAANDRGFLLRTHWNKAIRALRKEDRK